jgi:L-amino acid N-acyltransferase YncA
MSNTRKATMDDLHQIYLLYKTVARANPGNLTQEEYEITIDYVEEMLIASIERGLVLVIEKDDMIIGYMKAFTSRFKCLAHVLTDATLMIHPDYQKFGYGAKLFIKFLDTIKNNMLHIMKFEILPHDSNKFAVQMYEKLGFKM